MIAKVHPRTSLGNDPVCVMLASGVLEVEPHDVSALEHQFRLDPAPKLPHEHSRIAVGERDFCIDVPLGPAGQSMEYRFQFDGFWCAEIVYRTFRTVLGAFDEAFCFHVLQSLG